MKQYQSLQDAIGNLFGNDRRIIQKQHIYGGDINEAYKVTLDDGALIFMKSNRRDAVSNFAAEARGLQEIAAAGCIRVPELLGIGTDPGGFSFLLLEYAECSGKRSGAGGRIRDYWETFARELAAMHMHAAQQGNEVLIDDPEKPGRRLLRFGFPEDNFIGHTKQVNRWNPGWISFFRENRLEPQFRMAAGYFDEADRKRISSLLDHLDRYLTEPAAPALLHGDLWGGNVMQGSDGKAWLIDPAVYYGHPEADLAMTELFGGFPDAFYRTYQGCMNLQPGYQDRRDLYNLYHLLNHLNMFGSSYYGSVSRILRRYS